MVSQKESELRTALRTEKPKNHHYLLILIVFLVVAIVVSALFFAAPSESERPPTLPNTNDQTGPLGNSPPPLPTIEGGPPSFPGFS